MLLKTVGEHHQTLLFYEEARTSTVSVIRNQIHGERQLLINAVNEVTTRLVHDQSFKLLGHLGPLLHERPRTGVMICLGAGISAGAALIHPLERLDVVDLSSHVARGARYFQRENNGVLDHPRFHFHIDDGRQFLLNSREGYDVAIVDSTHPKAVDSWILYTKEFYELVRARLNPGGVALQWLPLHGLSEREFKIIVATFQDVFPRMTLWANVGFETYGQVAYAKLVGSKDGAVVVDADRLAQRLAQPAVARDLEPYGMASIGQLVDLYVAGPAAVRRWTADLPLQTDDHPIVPYISEFSSGRAMTPDLLLAVRSSVPWRDVTPEDPAVRRRIADAYEAQGLVTAGRLRRASELHPRAAKVRLFVEQTATTRPYYLALAARYPEDPDRLFESGTQLAGLGARRKALPVYERALELSPDDFRIRLNLALLLRDLGYGHRAVDRLRQLRDDGHGSATVLYNLGAITLGAGDAGVAVGHLLEALAWDPSHLGARLELGRAQLALGQLDRAEATAADVLRANRWVAGAHSLLGRIAGRRGDHKRAVLCHARAVELSPFQTDRLLELGTSLRLAGRFEEASRALRAALRIEPDLAEAIHSLGLVFAEQGRHEEAADQHLRTLQVEPTHAVAALHLGMALRGQGRAKDALHALRLAVRLQPRLLAARQQLAELERELRRARRDPTPEQGEPVM
jgi:tetratricopeptide (TPR) repeat protein/spermidine synthase